MNTSMTNSMMWRTTYAIGAFGLALLFAYGAFSFASTEGGHSLPIRILAASGLLAAAILCALLGRRELRDGKSTTSGRARPSH